MDNPNAFESKQNTECLESAQTARPVTLETVRRTLAYIVVQYLREYVETPAGAVAALLAWRALRLVGEGDGLGVAAGLVRGLVTSVRRDCRLHLVELDAWTWLVLGHPHEAEVLWPHLIGVLARVERDGAAYVEHAHVLDMDAAQGAMAWLLFRSPNPFDGLKPRAETWGRLSDGRWGCNSCCNGHGCDNPKHVSRERCVVCGGSGVLPEGVEPVDSSGARRHEQPATEGGAR